MPIEGEVRLGFTPNELITDEQVNNMCKNCNQV